MSSFPDLRASAREPEVLEPAAFEHLRDRERRPHARIDTAQLAVAEQFAALADPHVQGSSDLDQAI